MSSHPEILRELLVAGASTEPDDYNMEPLLTTVVKDSNPESTVLLIEVQFLILVLCQACF